LSGPARGAQLTRIWAASVLIAWQARPERQGERAAAMRPGGTSRPVRMNPPSFSLTRSRSHRVRGSAPVMTMTTSAGTCSRWPVRTSSSVRASRRAWPWPSAVRVRSRTSMSGRLQLGEEAARHGGGQRLAPYEQRDPGQRIWPGAERPDRLSLPRQRRTPALRPWRGLRRTAAPGPVARGRSCGRARRGMSA
jgi:hypothetical protein